MFEASVKKFMQIGLVVCGVAALAAGTAVAAPININISTADGDGADADTRGDTSETQSGWRPQIRVRPSAGTVPYHSYIRFDLAALEGLQITSASLNLFTELADGAALGRVNLVYGLNISDPQAARPGEGGWKELPDIDDEGNRIEGTSLRGSIAPINSTTIDDPDKTTLLGSFQADLNKWVGISGNDDSALVAFLNAGLNGPGVVTLILAHEQPEDVTTDNDWFRTKEHGSSAAFAPYLNITAVPEPGSLGLFGAGVLLLAARRRPVAEKR